jgi:hypothetical protein
LGKLKVAAEGNVAGFVRFSEMVPFLIVAALIPLPMIVGGSVIIRRVEDRLARRDAYLEEEPEEVAGGKSYRAHPGTDARV